MTSVRTICALLILLSACSPGNKDNKSTSQEDDIQLVKSYYPGGRLKSETEALGKLRHGKSKEYRKDGTLENIIIYENNRKNGPALNYYPDGKTMKTEINYMHGFKHGESKWYYPDGNLYRLSPYTNGEIHGTRIVYYENGTVQAEIPYRDGEPGMGLKEYNSSGRSRQFDASITFSEQDRISLDNTFRLSISLSDGSRSVEFFSGELTDGMFWNDQLSPITTESGVGVMEFHVSKGSFKMKTINIVAKIKTNLNNYHFIQREYHLALENKY